MILNMISGGGGAGGTLTITAPANTIVTISKDDITKIKTADVNGIVTFNGMETGIWTVTITDGSQTTATTVDVTIDYTTTIEFFATIAVTFPEGYTCICSDGTTTLTAPTTAGSYTFVVPYAGDWTASCTDGTYTDSYTVTITTSGESKSVDLTIDLILDNNRWDTISAISAQGTGKNYWAVGDCKAVYLSGTVGTLTLNTTLWVYILGFDHNKDIEGTGIQFGCFKTATGMSGIDVCLSDSKYGDDSTGGSKYFNMNHWTGYNFGGWVRCDMRYDILGSTDVEPESYGAGPYLDSQDGYAPTSTCATNPVENTLMSCLPEDLRAVMKPINKFTSQSGRTNGPSAVYAMNDYLPLLSEFEVFGVNNYANTYEPNCQKQYEYFSAGNSQIKYLHNQTDTAAAYWLRSLCQNSDYRFCGVSYDGTVATGGADAAYGIFPVFMV